MTPPELHPGATAGSDSGYPFRTKVPPERLCHHTRRSQALGQAAIDSVLGRTSAKRVTEANAAAAYGEPTGYEGHETKQPPAVTPFDRFCYHAREYGLFLVELSLKGVAYAAVIVLALQINEHLDDIVAFLGQLP